jgi:hypothetical protein
LGKNADGDAAKLASRIHASIPFGRPKGRKNHKELRLDAGFNEFVFLKSPVGAFANFGVAIHGGWQIIRRLGFDGELVVSNSNRDEREHLREDLSTLRFRLGPRFDARFRRFSLFAVLGIEGALMSRVVTTTNPNCKYFGAEDEAGAAELCDFDRSPSEKAKAFAIGAALSLGISHRLSQQVFVGLRAQGAGFVYATEANGLNFPIGGAVTLGYQVY